MFQQIDNTINFIKKHRNKMAIGATIIGTIYAANKVVKSETVSELCKTFNTTNPFYQSTTINSNIIQVF